MCLGALSKTLVHVMVETKPPASRCCYAALVVSPLQFATQSSSGSHIATALGTICPYQILSCLPMYISCPVLCWTQLPGFEACLVCRCSVEGFFLRLTNWLRHQQIYMQFRLQLVLAWQQLSVQKQPSHLLPPYFVCHVCSLQAWRHQQQHHQLSQIL